MMLHRNCSKIWKYIGRQNYFKADFLQSRLFSTSDENKKYQELLILLHLPVFPSAGRDLSWSGQLANRLLQLGIKYLWCSFIYLQKCKKPCCFERRINQTAGDSFFNTALWANPWPKHPFLSFSSASSPQSSSSLHASHCHQIHLKNLMELAH